MSIRKELMVRSSITVDSVKFAPSRPLVLAAIEAFSERGFHGTTTRDIASRANLSPAAIYSHYSSKAELLYVIMRETHEELLEQMRAVIARNEEPPKRLMSLVKVHVEFHAERHTAARVANHELPALTSNHRGEILGLRREIEELVDETLEEGRARGAFDLQDVRATTFFILGVGLGVSRWFRPDGRRTPVELGDLYAELVARTVSASIE